MGIYKQNTWEKQIGLSHKTVGIVDFTIVIWLGIW